MAAGPRRRAGAALLLLSPPLALPGLLLWLPLQIWRRPFCYQPPPQCRAPPVPWRPPDEPARCFGFLSANLCLLPDGLARFSNLRHSQRRAEAGRGAPCGMLTATVPAGLDFVCLQMFDLRSERSLVSRLVPNLGPVLYDVGTFGLQPGPHLKLLGSGLLLASRYPLLHASFRPFPHASREESLASKGLFSAQVPAHTRRRSLLRWGWGTTSEGCWGGMRCCRRSWASWMGAARTHMRRVVSPAEAILAWG